MQVNKILIVIAFIAVLILGIILSLNIGRSQSGENPAGINLFPGSCNYNGQNYKSGERFPAKDGCNTCDCNNGHVGCTEMACGNLWK